MHSTDVELTYMFINLIVKSFTIYIIYFSYNFSYKKKFFCCCQTILTLLLSKNKAIKYEILIETAKKK